MRGKRAKQLNEQARLASLDGSVIKSKEYKRLKKKYNNPHYATVVNYESGEPMAKFHGEAVKERKVKYPFK